MSIGNASIHLDYAVVDVFAEQPFEGNPLAIFPDARGLTTEQMQTFARETNLSETTFVIPADAATEARDGVRVRIFTTEEEFPFAGHPTLGTASWLRANRPELAAAQEVRLLLGVGPVPVRFEEPTHGQGLVGTMRQPDPAFGKEHDPEVVAGLLGLPVEALDGRYPVQTVSTGLPFCVVPVASVAALAGLRMRHADAADYLRDSDAKFFYCVAPADEPSEGFRARMQFYSGEDPATGSAAGCAAAWLVRHGRVPSGQPVVIAQGVEMRRPSRITVSAAFREADRFGRITDVFVSGRTIPVASGRFLRPL